MKVSGNTTKRMAKEHSGMLMETSMRANGRMIRRMATVFTLMSMVHVTRAIGRRICSTGEGLRRGQMVRNTKAITFKGRRKVQGNTRGVTCPRTMDNGTTTR